MRQDIVAQQTATGGSSTQVGLPSNIAKMNLQAAMGLKDDKETYHQFRVSFFSFLFVL
jgi:hypothetical protein